MMSALTVPMAVSALLVLAVILGWVRLGLWQRRAGAAGSARWRLAVLGALQPLVAGALYLTLFPPAVLTGSDTLLIATAGTSSHAVPTLQGRLIALPEGPRLDGAEAVPDLATALRRNPATRRLVVLGRGLTPRDLDSAAGRAITFASPPLPEGVVALAQPGPVAPGSAFPVTGRAVAPAGARIELVDPAGRLTDRAPLGADGGFALTGTTRAAGAEQFVLRLRRADGRVLDEAEVPVLVAAPARPRLLILAGAPAAEIKFLRRWATDAGLAVEARIAAGGGVTLGDPAVALTAASLRRFDAVIVDERAWAGLGGARGVLVEAVRGGLGLLLRADDEEGTRALWRGLGVAQRGAGLAPVTLAAPAAGKPVAPAMVRTRLGIGTRDVPPGLALDDPFAPELARLAGAWQGADLVPFLADAGGHPLAAWRPLGEGRVAAFAVVDSHALALTGQADLFAQWWSSLLGTIARPAAMPRMVPGIFRVGERADLCGPVAAGLIAPPAGPPVRLVPDRGADHCAAYWPQRPGWHRIGSGDAASAFFVRPAGALPALHAGRDAAATLRLAMTAAAAPEGQDKVAQPGSPWPWFLLWLIGCAALWLVERTSRGRGAAAAPPGA